MVLTLRIGQSNTMLSFLPMHRETIDLQSLIIHKHKLKGMANILVRHSKTYLLKGLAKCVHIFEPVRLPLCEQKGKSKINSSIHPQFFFKTTLKWSLFKEINCNDCKPSFHPGKRMANLKRSQMKIRLFNSSQRELSESMF